MTQVVVPSDLGPEFDLGNVTPNRIRMRLGENMEFDSTNAIAAKPLVGGRVNAAGDIVSATSGGISSQRISTGLYRISFTPSLTIGNYGIILTHQSGSGRDDYTVSYLNVSATSFDVEVAEQDNGGTAGVFRNLGFTFLVVGAGFL